MLILQIWTPLESMSVWVEEFMTPICYTKQYELDIIVSQMHQHEMVIENICQGLSHCMIFYTCSRYGHIHISLAKEMQSPFIVWFYLNMYVVKNISDRLCSLLFVIFVIPSLLASNAHEAHYFCRLSLSLLDLSP